MAREPYAYITTQRFKDLIAEELDAMPRSLSPTDDHRLVDLLADLVEQMGLSKTLKEIL
jgi:hypothetical protein